MRSFRITTVAVALGLLAGCSQTSSNTAADWGSTAADVVSDVSDLAGDRAVYVLHRDRMMPFADAYRSLLVSQFNAAGVRVAASPAGAVVVAFDVDPVAHAEMPEAIVTTQVYDGDRLLMSRSDAFEFESYELLNFAATTPAPVVPPAAAPAGPLPVKQFAVVGDSAPADAEVADRIYRRMLRK